MDSFEWNKVAGAVLGAVLFVLGTRVVAETLFHVEPLEKQAYVVEGVEEEGAAAAPAAPVEEPLPDFAAAIPAADLAAGEAAAAKCAACHVWAAGAAPTIGPNLHNVVGRAKASTAGFDYSPAMHAKGGDWSYDELFRFLKAPPAYVPGTKMLFAGVPRAQERIDIIAFLRMQADAPAALPPPRPAEAAAPAEGAPAEGAPPEGAAPAEGAAAPAPAEAAPAPAAH
jgi:cytochrome c